MLQLAYASPGPNKAQLPYGVFVPTIYLLVLVRCDGDELGLPEGEGQ